MICSNGRVNILDNNLNQFDLMDKIPSNNKAVSYCDALNGNVENTNLSNAFFSSQNIAIIQNGIKKGVYDKSEKIIDNQNVIELKIIMRSTFLQGCINSSSSIILQIKALNQLVINYCVKTIYSELISYFKYRKDVSTLAIPQDLPILLNQKNKTLELKRWF